MDVTAHIQQLMDERGWTEYRLRKTSGLAASTLQNIFHRGTTPSIATLEIICKAFGITMSQFFAEGGEPVLLTESQRALLDRWDRLSPERQKALIQFIDSE